jgi:hypothetical protein
MSKKMSGCHRKLVEILIAGLLFLAACQKTGKEYLIFDFESDQELDFFHWKCHSLFSISSEHVTHGHHSLRLELFPSDYPGLSPQLKKQDWSGYRALAFDVFNPQNQVLNLTVRIDDRKDDPEYEDRFNQGFDLMPGMNSIRIPFSSLLTSRTHRPLDLKTIRGFLLFRSSPPQKEVLFFDYCRLEI